MEFKVSDVQIDSYSNAVGGSGAHRKFYIKFTHMPTGLVVKGLYGNLYEKLILYEELKDLVEKYPGGNAGAIEVTNEFN